MFRLTIFLCFLFFTAHSWALSLDPEIDRQWALRNQVEGVDIGLVDALEDFGPGQERIIVAVIDTGARVLPDLAPNIWSPLGGEIVNEDDVFGVNFIRPENLPIDNDGHGTHISSIIGAVSGNDYGIMGIAQNVEIMVLQHLGPNRYGLMDDAAKAIHYALDHGARVINCSWGGDNSTPALDRALARAEAEGVLVVAGAGNDRLNNDHSPFYPANSSFENIISVAAVKRDGGLYQEPDMYWGTNIGPNTVHIAAPGQDILGYGFTGELEYWSGTSQAAGVVSGVAAFVLSHEPHLNAVELKERLIRTGRPLRSLRGKTISGKMVNAHYALKNTKHPKDPNDPIHWNRYPFHIETDHPYSPNMDETYTIHVPGASRISVHFERIQVENRDPVTIYDGQGNEVVQYRSLYVNEYSPIVEGDTLTLRFQSDSSVERWGFLVDHIAYE